jgi:hypothetical protein
MLQRCLGIIPRIYFASPHCTEGPDSYHLWGIEWSSVSWTTDSRWRTRNYLIIRIQSLRCSGRCSSGCNRRGAVPCFTVTGWRCWTSGVIFNLECPESCAHYRAWTGSPDKSEGSCSENCRSFEEDMRRNLRASSVMIVSVICNESNSASKTSLTLRTGTN